MINKKLFTILFLGMFLISFIGATQDSLPNPIIKGACVDLIQTCSDCSFIELTSVLNPDATRISIVENMTKNGIEFNYTFCNTSTMGYYVAYGYGNPIVGDPLWDYSFEVNESGVNNANFYWMSLLYILLLVLSYVMIYKWATFNGGELRDYNYFFWAGFIDLAIGVNMFVNGIAGAGTLFVNALTIIMWASGAVFLLNGIVHAINNSFNAEGK